MTPISTEWRTFMIHLENFTLTEFFSKINFSIILTLNEISLNRIRC